MSPDKCRKHFFTFFSCQGNILADLTQNDLIEGTQCIRNKVCITECKLSDKEFYEKLTVIVVLAICKDFLPVFILILKCVVKLFNCNSSYGA